CLAEAMLMGRVLDQKGFVAWLDQFLPPVYSPAFKVYQSEIDTTRIKASGSNADADDKNGLLGSKSHLIGLAFYLCRSQYAGAGRGQPEVGSCFRLGARQVLLIHELYTAWQQSARRDI